VARESQPPRNLRGSGSNESADRIYDSRDSSGWSAREREHTRLLGEVPEHNKPYGLHGHPATTQDSAMGRHVRDHIFGGTDWAGEDESLRGSRLKTITQQNEAVNQNPEAWRK
jgi:hypothetical protein